MLGILIPSGSYFILRYLGKFSSYDTAAIAGHYGSVSAVTFAVATQFLASLHVPAEGYMSAFLAVLEPTGVVMGILLARLALLVQAQKATESHGCAWLKPVFHESLTGKGSMI